MSVWARYRCRLGWHEVVHRETPQDRWAVACTLCKRTGHWSLMTGHITWKLPKRRRGIFAWLQRLLSPVRARQTEWLAQDGDVRELVAKTKALACNEYARAVALSHRERGGNVKIPPSMVGKL